MKHFCRKIILTVLLAAGMVIAFSWIVVWQNYRKLSADAAKEKPLNREAVNDTIRNLSESWDDYKEKITKRYEVEAVFAALALQSVNEDEIALEEEAQENSIVISIENGELSAPGSAADTLGLDKNLFTERTGSFPAPGDPSTLVVYSRIGDSSNYYVEWFENTVIDDILRESIDIPGILKRTENTYDVSVIFVSCDPDSGEISNILYKNDRYFPDCEKVEDLGITLDDLKKNDAKTAGTLTYDDVRYTYVSGKMELPAGYVILLEPVPNLIARAFGQAGYMIAALIVLVAALLVAGFSLYPYVRNNILTPEEEKNYMPSHIRSLTALFGVFGLIVIALCGMFIYALSGRYDDVARGRERLDMMDESISQYAERYSQSMQYFNDVYLDMGNHIAAFLDTYPELRDPAVLSTLAESISASSITLYDSEGREALSSGPWTDLELSTDPDSTTYDFRRILKGVSAVVHDLEVDEQTGLNEMRLGIRIQDGSQGGKYGVMMLCVDVPALMTHEINPEKAVGQIFQTLSDQESTLWIADAKTGRILLSADEELEGKNIVNLGLSESDLKDSLVKVLQTDEGSFFITSAFMETPSILGWTGSLDGIIAYYKGRETSFLSGMISMAITGCILFLVIYAILSRIILGGYTDDFFNQYKRVKGFEDNPGKKLNSLRRALTATSPGRRGVITMEIITAVFLLQMIPIINSESPVVKNTVYHYISAGDWERGFNLFAFAAILILLSKVVLLVIGLRLVLFICALFTGPKGKTIFRLLSSVTLYISLFFFLIKAFEYLGFSPTAIAAALGSVGLAISLGAQNFVADIFAGLTFVFEGTLHVGDNVEIAVLGGPPYQGRVEEVGVRCIKVLTREGDLITCGNRDVRIIKNSTQMNTRVICELVVSSEISADDLEQILKTELPDLFSKDRRVLSGPVYNGVTAIGEGRMKLSVSAECSEEDYYYVKDKLNVSVQRIFREHGYSI